MRVYACVFNTEEFGMVDLKLFTHQKDAEKWFEQALSIADIPQANDAPSEFQLDPSGFHWISRSSTASGRYDGWVDIYAEEMEIQKDFSRG